MKKRGIILSGIILVVIAATVFLSAKTKFSSIEISGFMVGKNTKVAENLVSGANDHIELTKVEADEDVYKTLDSYLIGEERKNVDVVYPQYFKGGKALYFFSENGYLLTSELEPYATYESLIVSNGSAYGSDLMLTDEEDYIFLQMNNGLYMNVQDTIIRTPLGDTHIPSNSIMYLSEEVCRWYVLDNDTLVMKSERALSQAKIIVGNNSYDYKALLKGLNIIVEATKKIDNGKSANEEIKEAQDIVLPSYEKDKEDGGKKEEHIDVEDEDSDPESDTDGDQTDDEDDGDGSDKDEDGDKDDDDDPNQGEDDASENDDGEGEGKEGESTEEGTGVFHYRYIPTKVSISDIDSWAYAFNGQLSISDIGGNLVKGVSISIFKDLKGDKKVTGSFEGHKTYSGETNIGKSTALKKTYKKSQEITMATLEPNRKFYIQISYKYDEWTGEFIYNDKGEIEKPVTVRKTYNSDFIEFSTKSLSDSKIKTLDINFEPNFAAYSNAIEVQAFTLRNTTDYNSEDTTFANFKLNTIPYATRLVYTLTDKNGNVVNLNASASVLKKAANSVGGTIWKSSGTLTSDTKYTATVALYDKWNNKLPLTIDGVSSDKFKTEFYTSKLAASCIIEEVENVTDSVTVKITVRDTDDSLLKDTNGKSLPLMLQVIDSEGNVCWVNAFDENGNNVESDDAGFIYLKEPKNGSTYQFKIDSLAFAKLFTFKVYGNYNVTPKDSTTLRKPDLYDSLGLTKIYTASLSKGTMYISDTVSNLKDTSGDLSMYYNVKSTNEMFALIDIIRITITEDETGKVVNTLDITMDEYDKMLSDTRYSYNNKKGSITLIDGGATKPSLEIVAPIEMFTAKQTIWQTLFPVASTNEETGKVTYSSSSSLLLSFPEKSFKTSTRYLIEIQNIVKKASIEYTINTQITSEDFITKKIQPTITYQDFFVAGSVAKFIGLNIYDPDHTIEDINGEYKLNGRVIAKLFYGEKLVKYQYVEAVTSKTALTDLTFEDVIENGEYRIELIAIGYNDTTTYAGRVPTQTLATFTFDGSEYLNGKLKVVDVMSKSASSEKKFYEYVPAETINKLIDDKTCTDYMVIPEGARFLELAGLNNASIQNTYITFYKTDKTKITYTYSARTYGFLRGSNPIFIVPEGAEYYSLETSKLKANTFMTVSYYKGNYQNLFEMEENQSYVVPRSYINRNKGTISKNTGYHMRQSLEMYPVTPGQIYLEVSDSYDSTFALFDNKKNYIRDMKIYNGETYVIPEGVYYINATIYRKDSNTNAAPIKNEYGLYLIGNDDSEIRTARVRVTANDIKDYYGKVDSTITVKGYISDGVNNDAYVETPVFTIPLTMTKIGDDYKLDKVITLEELSTYSNYKLELLANYEGTEVALDTIVIKTNNASNIITCEADFKKVADNPYANYIVTNDITLTQQWNLTIYGIIDFDGHIVHVKNGATRLFSNIKERAQVLNVCVDYTGNVLDWFIYNNYGTVENFVVKTHDEIDTINNSIFINNYGVFRNFIMEIGADIILDRTYRTKTIFMGSNYGDVMENGYLYAINNAGLIFFKDPSYTIDTYARLLSNSYSWTTFRNIFIDIDSWHMEQDSPTTVIYTSGQVENIYVVGDYYKYSDGKSFEKLPKTKIVLGASDDKFGIRNVYSVNSYEATPTQKNIKSVGLGVLQDSDWQRSVIGDEAFEIDENIALGYYPRLKMPECMAIHQDYVPLRTSLADTVPELASDAWAEGAYSFHNDSEGYVKIRFKNPSQSMISNITFSNLDVETINGNQIVTQGFADDGLYDVVIKVKVNEKSPQYLSTYKITSFNYFTNGLEGKKDVTYNTTGFEFFKTVKNVTEWNDINSNMRWNYRLTDDIDFTGQGMAVFTINGNKTNATSTGIFYGKIYGDGHKLSNMRINNFKNAWVIYYASDATIKDLVIDNLYIKGALTQVNSYAGFIGAATRVDIDNVHITNSTLIAAGNVGLLVGTPNTYRITNCSVADSTVTATSVSFAGYYGGMIGYGSNGNSKLLNDYVRNVTVDSTAGTAVMCNGGMMGSASSYVFVDSCYAIGVNIKSQVGFNGGLVGFSESWSFSLKRCYVDGYLETKSSTGGVIGVSQDVERFRNVFVATDIISSSSSCHRATPAAAVANSNIYAYEKQIVNDLTGLDGCAALLPGKKLMSAYVWTDLIQLGDQFRYSDVATGYYPKLYHSETGELLYGQGETKLSDGTIVIDEAIKSAYEMPGQGIEFNFDFVEATIIDDDTAEFKYNIQMSISHEGITHEEVMEKNPTITIDGFDISDAQIVNGQAKIEWIEGATPDISNVVIGTNILQKAFDSYKLELVAGTSKAAKIVSFGGPIYWEISNINEWNDAMEVHGKTGENFKILADINFQTEGGFRGLTEYNDLQINRLEGSLGDDGKPFIKITKLDYKGAGLGYSWISLCTGYINNLIFEDIGCDLSQSTTSYNQSGFISVCASMNNVIFRNFNLTFCKNTGQKTGIVGRITAKSTNITGENIEVITTSDCNRSYLGGIVGYAEAEIDGIVGKNITICSGYNSDNSLKRSNSCTVGGLIGYIGIVRNLEAENINIYAYNAIGGGVGQDTRIYTGTIKNSNIKGNFNVGGIVGNCYSIEDILVQDCNIRADSDTSGSTGGVAYSEASSFSHRIKSIGNRVEGGSATSGVFCYTYGVDIVSVIDCEIISRGTTAAGIMTSGAYQYYPNMYNVVVRNTTIELTTLKGGTVSPVISNYSGNNSTFKNIYIAEDVTATLNGYGSIGGIFGRTDSAYNIKNVACGATLIQNESETVEATVHGCGGLIGMITFDRNDESSSRVMQNCYITSKLKAKDYVAGVIGYVQSDMKFETKHMDGVLFAGSIETNPTYATHTGSWITSDTMGSLGDAGFYVWDQATIDGEKISELSEAVTALGKIDNYIPASGRSVTSAEMATKAFYKEIWGTTADANTNWDLSHLDDPSNIYMPFCMDYSKKVRLEYTSTKRDKITQAGILLPGEAAPSNIVVYPIGVDKINIESDVPEISVAFGSGSPTVYTIGSGNGNAFGEEGNKKYIITLNYRYDKSVWINGTEYTTDYLRRSVSAYGFDVTNYWYFIENGHLYYGTQVGLGNIFNNKDLTTADLLVNAYNSQNYDVIHLWENKVLLSNGIIKEVLGTELGGTATSPINGTICDTLPFVSYQTVGAAYQLVDVNVYGGFTTIGSLKLDYRIFTNDGNTYTVSANQTTRLDSIVLTNRAILGGMKNIYFALVDDNGNFVNFKTNIKFPDSSAGKTGIKQISNDLYHTGNYFILRYQDGHVEVIDYYEKVLLYTSAPEPPAPTLVNYFLQNLGNMFGNSNEDTGIMNYSYQECENILNIVGGKKEDGADTYSLEDYADGLYIEGDGLYEGGKKTIDDSELEYVEGEGIKHKGKTIMKEITEDNKNDTTIEKVAKVTEEEYKKLMIKTLGDYLIAYDPVTGEYGIAETEGLATGEGLNYVTSELFDKANQMVEQGIISPSALDINTNVSQDITSSETRGRVLLSVAGVGIVAILAVIYFFIVRKRKNTK